MLELHEEQQPFHGQRRYGIEYIRHMCKTLPDASGVYRMEDKNGKILYVGKARSLRKRVASYGRRHGHAVRVQRMMSMTAHVEVIVTRNDAEALLLESNLIKRWRPPFNILLLDDKSFPYIALGRKTQEFAQIFLHRGEKKEGTTYYGPLPTSSAARETMYLLERGFLLRSCRDSVFKARRRPCLLYQIKRCSAPCVGRISKEDYQELVRDATLFLQGRCDSLRKKLTSMMEDASKAQHYERAARYRDRLKALATVHAYQRVDYQHMGDCDVLAVCKEQRHSCVQIFFFRHGRLLGNYAYYPRHDASVDESAILSAVIGQFYTTRSVPRSLYVSHRPEQSDILQQALSERAGHRVSLHDVVRGGKREVMDYVAENARQALARYRMRGHHIQQAQSFLQQLFDRAEPFERIEAYDNSHTSGAHAVGVMIVTDAYDFVRTAYRQFTIGKHQGTSTQEDDHAMMREVITRRFSKALAQGHDRDHHLWPDLLIIDGGKGQLHSVQQALEALGIVDDIPILAMAKGKERRAGKETFHVSDGRCFMVRDDDAVSHYLQRLRDEAHRFAVMSHRKKRQRPLRTSSLEDIKGIGSIRKRALLRYFGSAHAVSVAGIEDLKKVEGIHDFIAHMIYDYFHETEVDLSTRKGYGT
ncbi:MAG: excinuclease ABC subunit UvrC [Alphaproteobacteria bacterium GM7ARS4]|nr:excinuclease ABC subunit UvrC [Alphaproteobacteria bacterium GM7ARS4]